MLNSILSLLAYMVQLLKLFNRFFQLLDIWPFQSNIFQLMKEPILYCIIFLRVLKIFLYSHLICRDITINMQIQELWVRTSNLRYQSLMYFELDSVKYMFMRYFCSLDYYCCLWNSYSYPHYQNYLLSVITKHLGYSKFIMPNFLECSID